MPTPRPRLRRSVAPLLVLLLGSACATALAVDLDRRADEELEVRLEGEAQELALLFSSVAATFQTQMSTAATITAFEEGDPDVHRRYVTEGGLTGVHALVDLSGADAEVVHVLDASSEAGGTDAGAEDVAAVGTLVADPVVAERLGALRGRSAPLTFLLASDGRRAVASVATDGATTVADLFRFDVGAAGPYLVSELGSVEDFAIYLADVPDPTTALVASTGELPLRGPLARTSTAIGEEELLIEVRGSAAPALPPVVVALLGSALAAVLAAAHLVALRRRDTALAAVAAMEQAEAERRRMEADLQQAQRLESVGQLAGGVAHDVNNLLAAISSNAELIALDTHDERIRADVAEILDATRRGAALTRRLLTFSRRTPSATEPVDVDAVVRDLHPLLARTIGEDVDLCLDLHAGGTAVLADPAELEQVLLNLVVNARDASSGPDRWIGVRTRVERGEVVLEVADRGQGMTEEVALRAVEPFFSTKPSDEGSGLGLAIVYGIATRAGGSVAIDSAPGRGTRVRVALPAHHLPAPAARGGDETGRAPGTGELGREVVLLVEDEPAVRRAASRLLERAGHVVAVAADGDEALAALAVGLHPTVLVTDVVLPGAWNGRDVAQRIRGAIPDVRVVYASGYARDVISAEQLEAEGAAFVAKPFTSTTLLAAVAGTPAATA